MSGFTGGAWCVTEADLLRCARLPVADGVILDDLVPKGPEILMGRILEIRGYLDDPCTSDPGERYNPILITMEAVLHLDPREAPKDPAERDRLKAAIPVPKTPGTRIRTFNYLWKSWCPPRSFNGALLWDRHWDQLVR